jgi:hypothetical protein
MGVTGPGDSSQENLGDDWPDDGEPDDVEPDDVESEPSRPGPTTAYAVNWRTVLAVDAAMGGLVALAGVVAMVVWNFALGVFLTGLGCFYVAMVARRSRRWQQLRRTAGL